MNYFNFIFKGNIYFGVNSRSILKKIIKEKNYNEICVIIDHALMDLPIIDELLKDLGQNINIIDCDISEPTYDKLEEKRSLVSEQIDVFIGIGGGSALDLAKGLAVLNTNKNKAIMYRGFEKFDNPIPPIIAIPTTAGTGSEITPNASFIDKKAKRKMGINGEAIRPEYAILDPELTVSCPIGATVSAGVDSLVHATEAYVAKKSNPMAKIFAKKGFNLVFENLPRLIDSLENIELREKVMYGAFLSAIGLMNSGTGPAAAMSYPLGVRFGVPHGIGGGIFLPEVIKHNIENGFHEYSNMIDDINSNLSIKKNALNFYEKIMKTWSKLNVPIDLGAFGMNSNHIDQFVADTMELKLALDQNPVSFNENEIISILQRLNVG